MNNLLDNKLPDDIVGPLGVREPNSPIEFEINQLIELLGKFEPVDTLNGATELVDKNGVVLILQCDDKKILENNEYPEDYRGIYLKRIKQ